MILQVLCKTDIRMFPCEWEVSGDVGGPADIFDVIKMT